MNKTQLKFFVISLLIITGLFYVGVKFFGPFLGDETPNIKESINYDQVIKDGDIIFQVSTSSQSKAIQLATKSRYSHMGIIYAIENQFYVLEAIEPVSLTPLNDWIQRGLDGHFVVKRLRNSATVFSDTIKNKLKAEGEKYLGKHYDLTFEWSDDRIYCSELVWKVYKSACGVEIGNLQQLKDFELDHKTVREKLKQRYGNKVPLNEKVISPASMFDSHQLILVYEK